MTESLSHEWRNARDTAGCNFKILLKECERNFNKLFSIVQRQSINSSCNERAKTFHPLTAH